MTSRPLRAWLTGVLACIVAVPLLTVLVLHALIRGSSGPDSRTLASARTFAISGVAHWSDPAWDQAARSYFGAVGVDAELRPAAGPWFGTARTGQDFQESAPRDKFAIPDPGRPGTDLGSGWVAPHVTAQQSWTLALAGAAVSLLAAIAAAAIFLGHAVLRPLRATGLAAAGIASGDWTVPLPRSLVREVTRVTDALATMRASLYRAQQAEADAEEQRRLFVGAIAHDLRTPLFTLRAHLDGLADGLAATPDRRDRYLRACRRSATTLDRLVTELFGYARMEFLGQPPQQDVLRPAMLLEKAVEDMRLQARGNRVDLRLSREPEEARVTGDEHLLIRAISNVIDNALRHTPPQGRVDVACRRDSGRVIVTVTDTGPGIAPADLPWLFTPLYRGDSASRHPGGGSRTRPHDRAAHHACARRRPHRREPGGRRRGVHPVAARRRLAGRMCMPGRPPGLSRPPTCHDLRLVKTSDLSGRPGGPVPSLVPFPQLV